MRGMGKPCTQYAPRNNQALRLHSKRWGASRFVCEQSYALIDRDDGAKAEDRRQREEEDSVQWGE